MSDLQKLDQVIELLSDPERWTQGRLARTATGLQCDPLNLGAACWCLAGALQKEGCVHDLWSHLSQRTGGPLSTFNDDPNTTHEDVMSLLHKTRTALEKAQ